MKAIFLCTGSIFFIHIFLFVWCGCDVFRKCKTVCVYVFNETIYIFFCTREMPWDCMNLFRCVAVFLFRSCKYKLNEFLVNTFLKIHWSFCWNSPRCSVWIVRRKVMCISPTIWSLWTVLEIVCKKYSRTPKQKLFTFRETLP